TSASASSPLRRLTRPLRWLIDVVARLVLRVVRSRAVRAVARTLIDVRVIRWVFQIVAVGVVVAVLAWLWGNYARRPGGEFSLDFLDQPVGFEITGGSLSQNAPVRDALYEGLLNTLRVVV